MTPMLPSILIGTISTAAYLLAQLSNTTQVPLGEAVAGFTFIAGLVWWLSRKLQKIEDDISSLKRELGSRPCQRTDDDCPTQKDA